MNGDDESSRVHHGGTGGATFTVIHVVNWQDMHFVFHWIAMSHTHARIVICVSIAITTKMMIKADWCGVVVDIKR